MNNNIKNIISFFDPNSQGEIKQILTDHGTNPHINFLLASLQDGLDVKKLFDYGMHYISERMSENGDENTSEYFFILSELKDIPAEIKSFALDMSIYMEGKHVEDQSFRDLKPREEYKKIESLL